MFLWLVSLWFSQLVHDGHAFAPDLSSRFNSHKNVASSNQPLTRLHQSGNQQVDVSDLGLSMDDLNAPLPAEFFQQMETTGYESTSRIPSVQDDACMWTEEQSLLKVTLAIPGLRGQPAAALAVELTSNTISIAAFGMVVWSAILRGEVEPESLKFEASDGADMIPVIELEMRKKDQSERWGGFILKIGENSIL